MRSDLILSRLDKVKRMGGNQWMACCPAHEDKSPSLSIFENHDGRILVNCFAGCGGSDVMTAIGLSLSDLYPDGALDNWFKGAQTRRSLRDKTSSIVLEIAQAKRARGERLTSSEIEEEKRAFLKGRAS